MKSVLVNAQTTNKMIKTALLIDAFWDRWLVHGIDANDLAKIRSKLTSVENWVTNWQAFAIEKRNRAKVLKEKKLLAEAEQMYRVASLYYNSIYYVFPFRTLEKEYWYHQCLKAFREADLLSSHQTFYESIEMDGVKCPGRIRIPPQPRGVIILVTPIDSSKEELFQYESDFNEAGYITVSFDGPGQGESFVVNGLIGTKKRYETFMERLIDCTVDRFPSLPLYLFGTSLGASWALYSSGHSKVEKTAVVSPAVEFEKLKLPGYFLERVDHTCNPKERPIPDFGKISYGSPILMFHGKDDLMVSTTDMYSLYHSLPIDKKMIEYEGEGHCCNYKLYEIRKISIQWFEGQL